MLTSTVYTSNAAVWGDTGRHPLALVITKQVFAYLHRVQQMDTDDSRALVRHAVKEQENLSLDWFSKLQALKTGLMNKYFRSFNHPSQIRSGLKVWFEEVWNTSRVLNRKLGFYNKVKESFGPELYLSLKLGYFENKRVAQLRTSSHQYNIETGRHGQNRESVVNRICSTCSKNDDDTVTLLAELPFFDPIVEDETHVIQTCPLYEDHRKKLKAPTYIVLHEDPKLLFQTSTELRDFSRFLTNIHERRFPKKCPFKKKQIHTN